MSTQPIADRMERARDRQSIAGMQILVNGQWLDVEPDVRDEAAAE